MTEETQTSEFAHAEGENSQVLDSTAEETAAVDETSTDENEADATHSPDGDGNNQDDTEDDKQPLDQHPRWKEREAEWNTRFNEQESRHQTDIKSLREEFGGQRKANAEQTQVPGWFGGNQEQWDAYCVDRDKEIQQAEERAVQRISKAKEETDKAVAAATDFMRTELTAIQADKTLNPAGAKIDPQRLLKVVMETDGGLVDTQGRWNYRAAARIIRDQDALAATKTKPKPGNKNLSSATVKGGGSGEPQKTTVKTSADFRKNRPW